MNGRWGARLIASVLAIAPAYAGAVLPEDPNICVSPMEWGDSDAPPYATISIHARPQFFPGYPTPLFGDDGTARYVDPGGRLRTHPSPAPLHFVPAFFLGSDGNVYWPRWDDNYVFDRTAGYFREIDPGDSAEQRHAREIPGRDRRGRQ